MDNVRAYTVCVCARSCGCGRVRVRGACAHACGNAFECVLQCVLVFMQMVSFETQQPLSFYVSNCIFRLNYSKARHLVVLCLSRPNSIERVLCNRCHERPLVLKYRFHLYACIHGSSMNCLPVMRDHLSFEIPLLLGRGGGLSRQVILYLQEARILTFSLRADG